MVFLMQHLPSIKSLTQGSMSPLPRFSPASTCRSHSPAEAHEFADPLSLPLHQLLPQRATLGTRQWTAAGGRQKRR